jgi:hypothetical protein
METVGIIVPNLICEDIKYYLGVFRAVFPKILLVLMEQHTEIRKTVNKLQDYAIFIQSNQQVMQPIFDTCFIHQKMNYIETRN